jgi:alpha,alpha-trehalase
VVIAWVLARDEPEEAWRFLLRALESDVADVQGGTTAEGIHLGAMAGTVDLVQRCLTGMRARGSLLAFDPALPPEVKQLRFSVHYRGHRVDVALAEDRLAVGSRPGAAAPIRIEVRGQVRQLAPGGRLEFPLEHRAERAG